MSDIELAWAAGFVDGEGCIAVSRNKRRGDQVSLLVTQVDPRPLLRLRALLGGSIHMKKHDGNPRHRQQLMWRVVGRAAELALASLEPHLTVKREQAQLALELRHDGIDRDALVSQIKDAKWRPFVWDGGGVVV